MTSDQRDIARMAGRISRSRTYRLPNARALHATCVTSDGRRSNPALLALARDLRQSGHLGRVSQ